MADGSCTWNVGNGERSTASVTITPTTLTIDYGVNGWHMPAQYVFDRDSSSRTSSGAFGFKPTTSNSADVMLANALSRCANQFPQGSATRAALNGVQIQVRYGPRSK